MHFRAAHFKHGQVFCAARERGEPRDRHCRLHQRAPQRATPADVRIAVEIDLSSLPRCYARLRSLGIRIARSLRRDAVAFTCPALQVPGSTTSAASIRFVRKRIRPSIWGSRRLHTDSRRFHCDHRCSGLPPPSRPGRSLASRNPVMMAEKWGHYGRGKGQRCGYAMGNRRRNGARCELAPFLDWNEFPQN